MLRLVESLLLVLFTTSVYSADLAPRYPSDTRVFVTIADFDQFQQKLAATSMGRLWDSPAMAAFRTEFSESQQDFAARLKRAYGIDDQQLAKYATDSLTVGGIETKAGELSMTFLIEMSAENAMQMIADAGRQLIADGGRVSNAPFPILASIFDLPDSEQVVYATHDGFLLVSGDVGIATRIIEAWKSDSNQQSLATMEAYQHIMASPPRDGLADMRWYADVIRLAVIMEKNDGTVSTANLGRPPFPMRHGFPGIQGLGGFAWVRDEGFDFLTDIQVYAPPPREQALKSLDFIAGDLTPPDFVDNSVSNTMVNRWNLTSLLANIGDVYDDVTDAPGAWAATLDDWNNDLGFDLIGGLLPMLESEVVTHSDYLIAEKQERTLISIPIKNAKAQEIRVASLIYRFLRNDNKAVRARLPRQKFDLWQIALEDQQGNSTFTRAGVMVANGRLWLATHDSLIRNMVQGRAGPPLSESAEFAELKQRLDAWTGQRSFARGYVRGDRDIRHTYETLRSSGLDGLEDAESLYGNMLLMVLRADEDKPQSDTDFSKLPAFTEVEAFFGMVGTVANLVDSGWTIMIGAYDRAK